MGRLPPASSSLELLSPFVLRTAGSVFGLVNFLSLSLLLSHSLSCYLVLAPSDCPQGIWAWSLGAMPPAPLHFTPTCWWWTPVFGLLLHWELQLGV